MVAFMLAFLGNGMFLTGCMAWENRRSGQTLRVGVGVPQWRFALVATVFTWWGIHVSAGGGRTDTLWPLMIGWLVAVVALTVWSVWSWRRATREGVVVRWADLRVPRSRGWRAVSALLRGVILIPWGVLAIGVGAYEIGALSLVAGVIAFALAIRNLNRWVDQ